MRFGLRATLVISGAMILYLAFLLALVKPWASPPPLLPAFNPSVSLNALLVLLTSVFVFYMGWGLARPRHPLLGGVLSLIFFLLNPAVISQTAFRISPEVPTAALVLALFLSACLALEHWSTFMRSIVLAVLYAVLFWVYMPSAFWVLLAMIPWVVFHRRPLSAVGTWLTMLFLGSALFGASWLVYCAFFGHRSDLLVPFYRSFNVFQSAFQDCALSLSDDGQLLVHRLLAIMKWLSPFGLFAGGWAVGSLMRSMVQERRASTACYLALVAGMVLLACLFIDPLGGPLSIRYPVALAAVGSPFMALVLATRENFVARSVRVPAVLAFVFCGVAQGFWLRLEMLGARAVTADFLILILAAMAAGGLSKQLPASQRLGVVPRLQAVLTGSTLAYFLVTDLFLLVR